MTVTLPSGGISGFELDALWRECLIRGLDEMELTIDYLDEIQRFEADYHAYLPWLWTFCLAG